MSKQSDDADVIFNRANVALARSQRIIQSWLGESKTGAGKEANLWDEPSDDDDAFKPEPEALGVGAKAPESDSDFTLKRKQPSSNDKLLEQLLGRKAAKRHQASKQQSSSQHAAPKPLPAPQGVARPSQGAGDASDDEEMGRAGMIGSKPGRKRGQHAGSKGGSKAIDDGGDDDSDDVDAKTTAGKGKASRGSSKRKANGGSYLDQLLAEKATKKKKKMDG